MKLFLPLLLLLCSGCATATIETATVEGKLCKATYVTLFRDTDTSSMSACGGKGGSTGARANTELIEAFMQALVRVPK